MSNQKYKTLGAISIDEVFSYYGQRSFLYDGERIKLDNDRLAVFQKSLSCVKCRVAGNIFYIQRSGNWDWHLNLWCTTNGMKRLITIDHIIPLSKGGSSELYNLQTMCFKCNGKKADKLIISSNDIDTEDVCHRIYLVGI